MSTHGSWASGRADDELVWLGRLTETGEVPPYGADRHAISWTAYRETRGARDRLAHERERRVELAAEAEREAAALNTVSVVGVARRLQPPPGTEVWQLPEPVETTA